MELKPNNIEVRLETNIHKYEHYKELLIKSEGLLTIIPRNEEEETLLLLCKNDYSWDSNYIYKSGEKICKINFISLQVIHNPKIATDNKILEICSKFKHYKNGEEI